MRWYTKQKMEWIAETLRVFGFINRMHFQLKFGVSAPQASHDIGDFQKLHPGVMRYDSTQKKYLYVGGL